MFNKGIWRELRLRIPRAKRVHAAIAYVGQGGAALLPLQAGHRLVVDLSPRTVKRGATDPREIEKLMGRDVEVFTRGNLHAKTIVIDAVVLSSSANISKNAQGILDEAGILTNDRAAVRRARSFIEQLCTEPVGPEYLKRMKKLYRPPSFAGQREPGATPRAAKVWLVSLGEHEVPNSESTRYEATETRAARLMKDRDRSFIDSFHWPVKPRMAEVAKLGDWMICATKLRDGSVKVDPPAQLLSIDSYVKASGRGRRWVFSLEAPSSGQSLTWGMFRNKCRNKVEIGKRPRTRGIARVEDADNLLRIWTTRGRVSGS